MTLTQRSFGRRDDRFASITAYYRDGQMVAVKIPNAGNAGSTYYRQTDLLEGVLHLIDRDDRELNVSSGSHSATLANGIRATHNDLCHAFKVCAEDHRYDTATPEGLINALSSVHRKLTEDGLQLQASDPLVREIKAQKKDSLAEQRIQHPTHAI
jgi:hypothetical protein